MVLDPRRRFSAAVSDYRRHRPSYPPPLIDWILETAGLVRRGRITDVGCGTGIATRLFAARGHDVVGVDPNPDMLAQARLEGAARYVQGEAAATGLNAGSADLVTVAQAFHWFELPATLVEFHRILRPGGWCAAFWNLRAAGPFQDAYDALLHAWSREYAALPKGRETLAALRASPPVCDAVMREFENQQPLDCEGFIGRVRSSSYVAHGVADREGFESELRELFSQHQRDGVVVLRYRTPVLAFRIRPSPD